MRDEIIIVAPGENERGKFAGDDAVFLAH
jgi:hypothetical protein